MAARDPAEASQAAVRSGRNLVAHRLRDLTHLPRDLALARLGYDLKCPVFALPIYRYSLTGPAPTALRATPPDPWPGDAELGAAMVQGIFMFCGRRVSAPTPLWSPPGVEPGWLAELHGFAWLRDLRAAGGDSARRAARDLVASWIETHGRWSALAWDPLVSGRRLANWLACYEFFAASAAVDYRHHLFRAMSRQAQHLQRILPAGLAGADLIAALKGLVYAGACLPGGQAWRRRGLGVLRRELPRQILADGGHAERSPARQLSVLRDLIDIRATLHKVAAEHGDTQDGRRHGGDTEAPVELQQAIERMAPMLRMFQHGDGGLALFNGANEEEGWRVDIVLQRATGRRRPLDDAPDSGFQRLRAGRTLVLIDTGAPPPPGLDAEAHAGTLGMEVSVGRERLIVNCGARTGDPAWTWAQRVTAAHSTVVVNDTNSSEVLPEGGFGRRALVTRCRREEDSGNLWLEVAHDGYRRNAGLIHHRRLYLAADGTDLRGEDRLTPDRGGCRAAAFSVRFHLHPGVQASLAQGGDAALLRLPKGGGWRLHARGGGVNLEPSIYLGRSGEIRRSQQIVLTGPCGPRGTTVKWSLRRIDRKRA